MDSTSSITKSIINNYEVLLKVREEVQSDSLDGEMSARIVGVETQMTTFEFLVGVHLGLLVMRHTNILSKSLQQERLSAAQGQQLAKLTLSVLEKTRVDV